jgi:hypothetical protein
MGCIVSLASSSQHIENKEEFPEFPEFPEFLACEI